MAREDTPLTDGPGLGAQSDRAHRTRLRLVVLIVSLAIAAALVPVDGPIAHGSVWVRAHLGGDVKRELEVVQQFGDLGSLVLVGVIVWLMDPARRRRLWDLVLATIATGVVLQPIKMLVGRPRPKLDDPLVFLGPWGRYEMGEGVGLRHAWEVGSGISSDLWSMPSSHTAHAVVLGVFLARVYPPLKPVAVTLVVLVGVSRVLLGAHYPSDVVVGGAVAWVITDWVLGRCGRAAQPASA